MINMPNFCFKEDGAESRNLPNFLITPYLFVYLYAWPSTTYEPVKILIDKEHWSLLGPTLESLVQGIWVRTLILILVFCNSV
jgi:hypothetical protein